MAFSQSNAIAIVQLNALVDALDTGGGVASFKIYDDTAAIPAFLDDAITTQVLLASVNLANPAFGAASDDTPGAIATLLGVPLSDNDIDNAGTAAFFRAFDRAGTALFQGKVGLTSAEMIVDSILFVAGATFTISSCTVSIPEA